MVQTEKEILGFGGEQVGEYIIKSFIPIISERIQFETRLQMDFVSPSKSAKAKQEKQTDLAEGYILMQVYPKSKIEVSNDKRIKFSAQGYNFIIMKDQKDSL
jgi:hypothetical protein